MITKEMDALTRRAFLTASGALVVALAAPDDATAAEKRPFGRSVVRPDKLSSYISIDLDGTVVAYYGKIDGGQGLETSIAQLVAEEIDVPWEHVRVVMGDTGLTVDMGGATAGWLAQLPPRMIAESPPLSVVAAWVAAVNGRDSEVEAHLTRACELPWEGRLPDGAASPEAASALLRESQSIILGKTDTR